MNRGRCSLWRRSPNGGAGNSPGGASRARRCRGLCERRQEDVRGGRVKLARRRFLPQKLAS
eukprot:3116455-Alexandrium_andersonii.AAC.1